MYQMIHFITLIRKICMLITCTLRSKVTCTLTTKSQTKQIRKMISKLSVTPHGGSGLGPRNRGSEESLKKG